jgi:acetyl esterase
MRAAILRVHGGSSKVEGVTSADVGVAPAIVITAGFDPLRDGGLDYIERLRKAGVTVATRHYPDQIHGFAFMPGVIPAAHEAITAIAGRVHEAVR